jgi:hypothetical protein
LTEIEVDLIVFAFAQADRKETLNVRIVKPSALFDQRPRHCRESAKLGIRRGPAGAHRGDIRGINACLKRESGMERDCPGAGIGHSVGEQNRLNLRLGKAPAVNLVEDADKALYEHRRCCHGTREVRNRPEPRLHVAWCRFGVLWGGVERMDRETFHENCL